MVGLRLCRDGAESLRCYDNYLFVRMGNRLPKHNFISIFRKQFLIAGAFALLLGVGVSCWEFYIHNHPQTLLGRWFGTRSFIDFLVTNFVICFLLALLFQGLMYSLFARQVAALTRQLQQVKERFDSPLSLKVSDFHQDDELGLLTREINRLWNSRLQLQKSLAERNQFITTVTAISPVGLFRADLDGKLLWYNQRTRMLLGLLGNEQDSSAWLANVHPSHSDRVLAAWRDALERRAAFHQEFMVQQANQQIHWVMGEATPSWSDGACEGFVGTLSDITPLKLAVEQLQASEKRYQAITQTAPTAIVLLGAEDRVSYWNPAAERIFGYSPQEALGRTLSELILPAPGLERFREFCTLAGAADPPREQSPCELMAQDKDGRQLPIEISLSVFEMEHCWHIAMLMTDVSKRVAIEREKHQLYDQLRQAQKMEAIGTMAGGIAHDFNNILTPILGFAQLLQDSFATDSKEYDRIDKILTSASRAKDLAGQILSFSRKSQDQPHPMLVLPVVKEGLKLLRAGIPTSIRMVERLTSERLWIDADATRLYQILMNLANNAVHSMHGRTGTLTIELNRCCPSEMQNPASGEYLVLRVSDTGTGIDKSLLPHIFEPYFTTKAQHEGTGLGLSVVKSNVLKLGGSIDVSSEPGRGTSFQVLLPLLKDSSAREQHTSLRHRPRGAGQWVLLVDDEKSLIHIGREFLENLGYRVESTTSSVDALALIERQPQRFAVLITDQTMPELTGLDLAGKVKTVCPNLPIIICTGQPRQFNEVDLAAAGIFKVIGKPDIFDDLADTLVSCLPPTSVAVEA